MSLVPPVVEYIICFVDEKAVQFAQAEKLYYEAALISSTSTTSSRNPPHNNNVIYNIS